MNSIVTDSLDVIHDGLNQIEQPEVGSLLGRAVAELHRNLPTMYSVLKVIAVAVTIIGVVLIFVKKNREIAKLNEAAAKGQADLNAKINELTSKNLLLQETITELNNDLSDGKIEITSLKKTAEAKDIEITSLKKTAEKKDIEIKALDDDLDKAYLKIKELQPVTNDTALSSTETPTTSIVFEAQTTSETQITKKTPETPTKPKIRKNNLNGSVANDNQ